MTIIVAVKDKDEIIIGADKQVTSGDMILDEMSSKILIKEFKITHPKPEQHTEDKFLIAFSGVYSLFELLKTYKAPRKRDKVTFNEYLYRTLIPSLNDYLKEYNFIQDFNGLDGVDWELLIVYHDKMYSVEFNLGLIEITSNYVAIGTAREIAYGSLHTSYNILTTYEKDIRKMLPKFHVKNALKACAYHSTVCNGQYDLYKSKYNKKDDEWVILPIE